MLLLQTNKMDVLINLFSASFEIFLLISPIVVFLPQYLMMQRTKSVGSFSEIVCYILIIAALLRIIFWFGEKYNFYVFSQAVIMLIVQIFLLKSFFEMQAIAEYSPKLAEVSPKIIANHKMNKVLTKIAIGYMMYFTTFMFFKSPIFIELTGFFSATIEAALPLPQFLNNLKHRSVEGLRLFKKFGDDCVVVEWRFGQIDVLFDTVSAGCDCVLCQFSNRF